MAVVGGLAAIHYHTQITTVDIDVVVARDGLDAFLAEVQRRGITVKKHSAAAWHQLEYHDAEGKVEIEVVPEGRKSPRDPAYAPANPSPQELGVEAGLGYASFAGWVVMKLVANREKDRYHLIEALKKATPEQIAEAVQRLRPLHASYLREFERLTRAAEDEDQKNW